MKPLSMILLFFGLAVFSGEPTFVYLVRHAEKQDKSRDPSLSALGKSRVEMLQYFFAKVPLQRVYATQYKRTLETVRAIAKDHQLDVTVIQAQNPKAQTLAIKKQSGGSILVAGHSNTIPALIHSLGGPTLTISEAEYDNLFLIVLNGEKVDFQHFQIKANRKH